MQIPWVLIQEQESLKSEKTWNEWMSLQTFILWTEGCYTSRKKYDPSPDMSHPFFCKFLPKFYSRGSQFWVLSSNKEQVWKEVHHSRYSVVIGCFFLLLLNCSPEVSNSWFWASTGNKEIFFYISPSFKVQLWLVGFFRSQPITRLESVYKKYVIAPFCLWKLPDCSRE